MASANVADTEGAAAAQSAPTAAQFSEACRHGDSSSPNEDDPSEELVAVPASPSTLCGTFLSLTRASISLHAAEALESCSPLILDCH